MCSGHTGSAPIYPHIDSLLLQVVQTLLCPLEPLQVLHHFLHVLLGVAVLDVGKPAAAYPDHNGHHQHEVLQVVVTVHWRARNKEANK